QAAHVPPARGRCPDQPPGLQQRRPGQFPGQCAARAQLPRGRRPAGPEHRQERGHTHRRGGQRLPAGPGRCVPARRLHHRQ
ncbi:putative Dihydroorotate dehydrogenase, partial [Daphnia magna]